MLTFKNLTALSLFLYGTTFLWMTAAFVGHAPAPSGVLWAVVNALTLIAAAGFAIVAWAVFKEAAWWEPLAVTSAAVGLLALVPYGVAIGHLDELGDAGVQMNIAIHALGSAAVLALVLIPTAHDWMVHRLG